MSQVRPILWVLQTGFLGDCVLSLPFLYRLAELHPTATIKIVCRPSGEEVFRLALGRGLKNSTVQFEVKVFDKKGRHQGPRGLLRFLKELGLRADAVFCLQRSFRSGLLAVLSRARYRIGFSSGAASYLYNVFASREWDSGKSEIEKNLDLLRAYEQVLGRSFNEVLEWHPKTAPSLLLDRVSADKAKPSDIDSSSQSIFENTAEAITGLRTIKNIALSLGSPWGTKRWSVEHAKTLVQDLTSRGIEVRLVGDAQAGEIAELLKKDVPSLLLKDFCGKTSVSELVDMLAHSDVLISNDSAPIHIASDLNIPTIALFGPTLPEFGFAPWRRGSMALGVKDLPCRPCHIHGPMKCPLGHHKCMKELNADFVLRNLKRLGTLET